MRGKPSTSGKITKALPKHQPVIILIAFALVAVGSIHPIQAKAYPHALHPPATLLSMSPSPNQPSPAPANYDEQLAITFTQSFTSIAYNVTAVAQSDSDGYGPAYLLNGVSDTGYWYQVGVSYNWPYSNGGYNSGFFVNYEVFNAAGKSVFPSNGGGGLTDFSGSVNNGDEVLLNLYFSNGQVIMLAQDMNTGAQASETYAAEGTKFVESSSYLNSNGFFTGLMTEWYHVNAYYGGEKEVTYSNPSFALSSGYMWADEYNTANASSVQFSDYQFVSFQNPNELQTFTTNGASEYADAYTFITGEMNRDILTLSYSIAGGGAGYSPPSLTYIHDGAPTTIVLTMVPTTFLADPGTPWSVPVELSGGSATERWQTNLQTEGTVSPPHALSLTYYHQFQVSFGVNVIGGGGGYSAPSVQYLQFGSSTTAPTSSTVWADATTGYSYTSPLVGSTPLERWDSPTSTGTVDAAGVITASFYHQISVSAGYSLIGGGAPTPPSLSGTQFGEAFTPTLGTTSNSYWLDNGTEWRLTNPLGGSTSQERWLSNSTTSGLVSATTSLSPAYYHQYALTLSYSITGGSAPTAPSMVVTQFGRPFTVTLGLAPTAHFFDAGSNWTLPSPLLGSSSQERWVTNQVTGGTISGAMASEIAYEHQYHVTTALAHPVGGSITSLNGWYNQSAVLQILASAAQGWKFESWGGLGRGSYSGSDANTSISVDGPIVENATFYPGLRIISSSNGYVTYAYGSTTGTVPAGTAQTIYAPIGTTFSMKAIPSSIIYEFTEWGKANTGTANGISVTLSSPEVVQAIFSYNYPVLGATSGAIIAAVATTIFVIRRGKLGRERETQ